MGPLCNLLFATTRKFFDHLVAYVKTYSSTAMSIRQAGNALESRNVGGQLLVGDYTDRMGTDTEGHGSLVRTSQFSTGWADADACFAPALSGLGPFDVGQFHGGTILLNQGGLEPTTMVVAVAVASMPNRQVELLPARDVDIESMHLAAIDERALVNVLRAGILLGHSCE